MLKIFNREIQTMVGPVSKSTLKNNPKLIINAYESKIKELLCDDTKLIEQLENTVHSFFKKKYGTYIYSTQSRYIHNDTSKKLAEEYIKHNFTKIEKHATASYIKKLRSEKAKLVYEDYY